MQLVNGMGYGIARFMQREDGVSFIECALVVSLAAVVAGIAFLAFSKHD